MLTVKAFSLTYSSLFHKSVIISSFDTILFLLFKSKLNIIISFLVNEISDFKTNDNYKELRAVGTYPAAGYFHDDFNDNLILNTFTVRQDSYYGYDGYDVKTSETSAIYLSKDSVRFFYVVQLY